MKKNKGLLVASILVGILTIANIFSFGFALYATFSGFGLEITDAVYIKQSDLVINYSQNNPDEIESYEVKIVNTTNKEFVDYEVRLTLYITNGAIDHYPHGSTATKIISIKPKEEKIIIFDEIGYLTSIDLENYEDESLELEYKVESATNDYPSYYEQFKNGKDFEGGVNKECVIATIVSGGMLLVWLTIEIILIIKYCKSGKKLIKEMIKKKQ